MRILTVSALLLCCLGNGCSDRQPSPAAAPVLELRIGSAPAGGTFHILGDAIAEALNAADGPIRWQSTALETKGSYDNILQISSGTLDFALANAATTHFAELEGYKVRVAMTLAPNIGGFLTRPGSNIQSLSDLKSKRVTLGPQGAGFEFFLVPLLVAHDLYAKDFHGLYCSQSKAVDLLENGQADAVFLGGALPIEAVAEAFRRMPVQFIPLDPLTVSVLTNEFPFYGPATIPAGTYPNQPDPIDALNVGSMHLITSPQQSDDLVYHLVKTIYQQRQIIRDRHPSGHAIQAERIAARTGTEFHPGAIRFYRELGVWNLGEKGL